MPTAAPTAAPGCALTTRRWAGISHVPKPAVDSLSEACRLLAQVPMTSKLRHAQVTREEAHAAIEDQFGGDTPGPTPGFNSMMGPRLSKMSSAYMLLVRAAC